jgi:hypothetical protein
MILSFCIVLPKLSLLFAPGALPEPKRKKSTGKNTLPLRPTLAYFKKKVKKNASTDSWLKRITFSIKKGIADIVDCRNGAESWCIDDFQNYTHKDTLSVF